MNSRTILIAYQDGLCSQSLSGYFYQMGYKIEASKALTEIIRKIRKGNIHVVLIEDEIEGVKACDVVPLLKNINPKIQIIVISSEESIPLVKRLRGTGIFYQAMKPVDSEEVKSAVKCAFEKIERESLEEGFFSFLVPSPAPA